MNIKTAALVLALGLLWPIAAPAAEPVPGRGMTMAQVKARFGQPRHVDPAVGQPPITRWLYADYTVYFERNICLHTVIDHPRPTDPPPAPTGNASALATADHDGHPPGPDTHRHQTATPAAPGDTSPSTAPPSPKQEQPSPPERDHPAPTDNQRPTAPSHDAPASSAPRAKAQQRDASGHFRFNAASGRVEIVNDAKADPPSAAPDQATDGNSTDMK